ncbi:nicotinate-nucleotide--dimethylbenzimidazole phosphoribosyltransferase [Streptomyces sp. NPDC059894]|uniref:nicotinate-nucleotide--dimethylbenzimidazole phosphoribosyltransferase n=1 Tax=unclassified Streptomyces TaxID=2593676 RepID=UPI003669A4A0
MTDTGQVPGEGLPENAGMVDQPGASAPGAYTYLSETTAEDEDLLLLPGAQSAWGNEVAPPAPEPVVEALHEPGPHETAGRDSGSVDLSAVRLPGPTVPTAPTTPIPPIAPRRPLHLGPPLPDTSASPVRSLADRGPAGAPVRHPGPPVSGPEYLDAQPLRETAPQGAVPWGAQAAPQAPVVPGAAPAETVVPAAPQPPEPVGVAEAVVARVATQAVATTGAPQHEHEHEHGHAAATPQPVEAVHTGGAAQPGTADAAQAGAGGAMSAEAAPHTPGAEPVPAPLPEPGPVSEAAAAPAPAVGGLADGPQVPEAQQVQQGAYAAESAADVPAGVQAPEPASAPTGAESVPSGPTEPGAVAPESVPAEPGPVPSGPVMVPGAEVPGAGLPVDQGAGLPADPVDGPQAAPAGTPAEAAPAGTPADAVPVEMPADAAPAETPVDAAPAVQAAEGPAAEGPAAEGPEVSPPAPAAPVAEAPADATAPAPAEAPHADAEAPADIAEVPVPGPGPEAVASDAPPAPGAVAEVPATDTAAPVQEAAGTPDAAAPTTPQVPEPVAPAVEQTAPAEQTDAAEQTAPAEQTDAAEQTAPAEQAAPAEQIAPVEQAVAAEQAVAVEQPDAPASPAAAAAAAAAAPEAPAAEPAVEAPAEPVAVPGATDAHLADASAVPAEGTPAEPAPQQQPAEAGQVPQQQPVAEAPVEPAPEHHPAPEPQPEPQPEHEPAAQAGHQPEQQSDPQAEHQPEQPAEPEPAAPGTPAPAHGADPAYQTPDTAAAPVAAEADPAAAAAAQSGAEAPAGESVPVDGTVQTAAHLAPTATAPHIIVLPDEPQAAEPGTETLAAPVPGAAAAPAAGTPVATVPAPRAADTPITAAAAPGTEPGAGPEPDPNVAQDPEDLDTRAADQEESTTPVEEAPQPTGPAAPAYDDAEREAVLKVMRERRDIRNGFRSDPIPHEVLLRVLEAAHTAPSVGHSQPWDFVVIRSADTRRAMHELAMRQRDAYAKSLPKGRAKQFKELKIEAILETPVNIVVTADPTRGGRHTLGRHTQPQMAPYSSALAVENLWLAARAEGLGVGWVSFFDEREMVRALGLPDHLEVVAYLCVGYVDEFPDEPELMQAGWAKRRPLSWVVHEETYGRRALPGEDPHDLLAETVAGIRPLDAKALGEAWERQKRMTKPAGALGMLEIISAQLSGLSRQCPPPIPEPAAVAVFAGDHGVHAQGVTPWPQEVTAQMVANFLGGGAVCNAFATQVGAEVCVVDVGVAADLPATPGLLPRKVRAGTSDMTTGPAMTREEAKQAIEVGIETARDLVAAGNKALLTGEMGIANTTASAALISVFTGADPAEVTGRGTGINDETLARKTEVVRRALELHQPDPADPIGVLAAIGGFEHAAMVGLLLGGASLRTPVILDGVSAGAAALVARAIAPEVLAACIAGHRSAEPGHVAALNKLGLRPLVDLDLRLGEGTGALLALPMVQSTARAMHEVATFDSAGVTEK